MCAPYTSPTLFCSRGHLFDSTLYCIICDRPYSAGLGIRTASTKITAAGKRGEKKRLAFGLWTAKNCLGKEGEGIRIENGDVPFLTSRCLDIVM